MDFFNISHMPITKKGYRSDSRIVINRYANRLSSGFPVSGVTPMNILIIIVKNNLVIMENVVQFVCYIGGTIIFAEIPFITTTVPTLGTLIITIWVSSESRTIIN